MLPLSLHKVVRKADPVHTVSKLHVVAINIQCLAVESADIAASHMRWHRAHGSHAA